jgi:hypothetical protein
VLGFSFCFWLGIGLRLRLGCLGLGLAIGLGLGLGHFSNKRQNRGSLVFGLGNATNQVEEGPKTKTKDHDESSRPKTNDQRQGPKSL